MSVHTEHANDHAAPRDRHDEEDDVDLQRAAREFVRQLRLKDKLGPGTRQP
jgi:hypothetical protein